MVLGDGAKPVADELPSQTDEAEAPGVVPADVAEKPADTPAGEDASDTAESEAEVTTVEPTESEPAPAKINLALHVTGRRPDGYHLLSSLVVFADFADTVAAHSSPNGRMTFTAEGPLANRLASMTAPPDNLVVRAATRLAKSMDRQPPPTRLVLTKEVPVAAGLGGGSADGAATLRLLNRHWGLNRSVDELAEIGRDLGADVPMCVHSRPLLAEGIGDMITPAKSVPALPIVLVHPRADIATAAVFARLEAAERQPLPRLPERFASLLDFVFWLRQTRNDLVTPAREENRVVTTVTKLLANDDDCLFARMSGSGAAAFGIFINQAAAERAAARLAEKRPDWWVRVCRTEGS